jgi:hypothetical protein
VVRVVLVVVRVELVVVRGARVVVRVALVVVRVALVDILSLSSLSCIYIVGFGITVIFTLESLVISLLMSLI